MKDKMKILESKIEMHRTSIYCPEDLYKRVKELATKADISVNSAMVQLLELGVEHVENNK